MGKEFGLWLTSVRDKLGFESQRQLAMACRLSNSTIARIESGEQEPSPETLKKLSQALRVSYSELMEKAGYMERTLSEQADVSDKLKISKYSPNETEAKSILEHTHPEMVDLLYRIKDLTEEEKESLMEHWKWAMGVIEKERERRKKAKRKS